MIKCIYFILYNKPEYSRILTDSHLFPPSFKMEKSFQNLDNILRDWAEDKVEKSIVEAVNGYTKQEEERISRFLFIK